MTLGKINQFKRPVACCCLQSTPQITIPSTVQLSQHKLHFQVEVILAKHLKIKNTAKVTLKNNVHLSLCPLPFNTQFQKRVQAPSVTTWEVGVTEITQDSGSCFWFFGFLSNWPQRMTSSEYLCSFPHKILNFCFAADIRPQSSVKEEDGKAICLQQDRNDGQGRIWVCPVSQLVHQHLTSRTDARLPRKR